MKTKLKPRTLKLHGDPRTTGRRETASERKHRRRRESRRRARPLLEALGEDEPVRDRGDIFAEAYELPEDNPCEDVPVIDSVRPEAQDQLADGRCHATTVKTGLRCKNKAADLYCKRHA